MTGISLAALYRECSNRFASIEPVEQVLTQPHWEVLAEKAISAEIHESALYRLKDALVAWLRSYLGHRDEPVRVECVRCLALVAKESDSSLHEVIDAFLGAMRDETLEKHVLEEIDGLAKLGKTAGMAHHLMRHVWSNDQSKRPQAALLLERLGDPAIDALIADARRRAAPLLEGLTGIANVLRAFGRDDDASAIARDLTERLANP